ncbi:hypothetical protein [Microbulbifer sp. JMSA008]|uniref:hypothetical protein n=1 Tax=Microbulbifer sp. JMSA008 TaxID=3243373 RepID=UPI00403A3F99
MPVTQLSQLPHARAIWSAIDQYNIYVVATMSDSFAQIEDTGADFQMPPPILMYHEGDMCALLIMGERHGAQSQDIRAAAKNTATAILNVPDMMVAVEEPIEVNDRLYSNAGAQKQLSLIGDQNLLTYDPSLRGAISAELADQGYRLNTDAQPYRFSAEQGRRYDPRYGQNGNAPKINTQMATSLSTYANTGALIAYPVGPDHLRFGPDAYVRNENETLQGQLLAKNWTVLEISEPPRGGNGNGNGNGNAQN